MTGVRVPAVHTHILLVVAGVQRPAAFVFVVLVINVAFMAHYVFVCMCRV